MNFLSGLWGGIKNVASTVGGALGNTASAITGALNITGPLNPSPNATKPDPLKTGTLSFYEDKADGTSVGTGSYNRATGQYTKNTNIISGGTTFYDAQGGQNNAYNLHAAGGVRPSTYTGQSQAPVWTAPVDQFGRESNKNQGNPYIDAKGNYITPKVGFEGLTGSGGSGFTTANSTPSTSFQGAVGEGASGYRGGGGGTMSSLIGQPESDEEERENDKGGTQTIGSVEDRTNQMTGSALAGMSEGVPTGPEVPELQPVIDAGWVQQMTEAVGQMEGYGGADRQQVLLDIGDKLQSAYQNLAVQAQERPPMTEDSPERLAFLESLQNPEEKNAMISALDRYEAQNTSLIRDEAQLDILKKQVRATDEIFTAQINEIKDNPNLPKALARKKVTDLLTVNERAMKNVMTNIGDLEMSINNQRRQVDMAFDIYRETKDDYRYQQKLVQDQIDRYLKNPAAFSVMSNADLKAFSQASGMSVAFLKAEAEKAITKKQDIEKITDERTGEYVYYDLNDIGKNGKPKELYRLPGGKGGSGGVSSVDTFAQAYLDGQIDITSVPQNERAAVLAKANELATAALNQPETTTQSSNEYRPSAREVGREVGPTIKSGYTSYANTVTKVADGITNFFGGLFGTKQ